MRYYEKEHRTMGDMSNYCYLLSPEGSDVSNLRQMFRSLNVTVLAPEDTPPPGKSTTNLVGSLMRQASFVCGVLVPGTNSPNVLFELGMAAGLGRPLFLIADPDVEISFPLQAYPHIRAKLDDIAAISFHLRLFLRNIKSLRMVVTSPIFDHLPDTHSIPRPSLPSLNQTSALEFEHLIAETLRLFGAEVVTQPRYEKQGKSFRPDLAVWFDKAPPEFSNPIIIEAKLSTRNQAKTIAQARDYLRVANVRTAIVVFRDKLDGISVTADDTGYVFSISVTDFIAKLQAGTLLPDLLKERNKFAHGGGV